MRIEIFKTEHLDMIDPIGGKDDKIWVKETLYRSLNHMESMAFTLFVGDKVISICGIWLLWDGVGEAFTVMCSDIKKYGLSLFKGYKRSLPTMIKAYKLKRLQATIIVGFTEGVNFIERLGFKREGMMKSWTPDGKDVYMYSIVED